MLSTTENKASYPGLKVYLYKEIQKVHPDELLVCWQYKVSAMGLDVSLNCLWPCKPRKWQELGFAEDEQALHLQRIL